MKVIKTTPKGLNTMRSALQKAEGHIWETGQTVKKSLTTTTIGNEEQEKKGREEKERGNQNWSPQRKEPKSAKERNGTGWMVDETDFRAGIWMDKTKGRTARGTTGKQAAIKGDAAATAKNVAGNTAGSAARGTVQVARSTAGAAVKGAASQGVQTAVKGAVGTAAKTAAGATAGAAAGTATAGTAAAAMAVAAAVKFSAWVGKKMTGALVSTGGGTAQAKGRPQSSSGTAKKENSGAGGIAIASFALFGFLLLIVVVILLLGMMGLAYQQEQAAGGEDIVAVARQEAETGDATVGGLKYKVWYGMDDNWCVMFLTWCADQCGYVEAGIIPKTASVAVLENWYQTRGLYHTKESGYEPKPGDIIFFTANGSHAGLVTEYNRETKIITTVEGNVGVSITEPYHRGSRVQEKKYAITSPRISGYGTPEYEAAEGDETDGTGSGDVQESAPETEAEAA